MEELRPCMADRFVLTMVNNRVLMPDDFEARESGAVWMTDSARRTFLKSWQEKKKETLTHPYLEEKLQWGIVPYVAGLAAGTLFARRPGRISAVLMEVNKDAGFDYLRCQHGRRFGTQAPASDCQTMRQLWSAGAMLCF